jgi:hypothetical protein
VSAPSGLQWESVIWVLVLGLLFWELRRLRASQRQDREKAESERQRIKSEASES